MFGVGMIAEKDKNFSGFIQLWNMHEMVAIITLQSPIVIFRAW